MNSIILYILKIKDVPNNMKSCTYFKSFRQQYSYSIQKPNDPTDDNDRNRSGTRTVSNWKMRSRVERGSRRYE